MKTIYFTILIIGLTLFSSCDSCLQCSYTYFDAVEGEDITVPYGTQCSPKRDLRDYEAAIMNIADSLGGTHVCVEQ